MSFITKTCESAQNCVNAWKPIKFFSDHLKSNAGSIKQSTTCHNVLSNGSKELSQPTIDPNRAQDINEICSNASGALVVGITLIFSYYVGTSFLSSAILKPFNLSRTWLSRINNLIEWQCKGATLWLLTQVCNAWALEEKLNADLQHYKNLPSTSVLPPFTNPSPATLATIVPDDLSTLGRCNWLCPSFVKDLATTLMTACKVNEESKSNAEGALIVYTTAIALTYIAWSTIVSKSCQQFNLSKKFTASLHKTFAEWPLQAFMIGTILKTFNAMGELGEIELRRRRSCRNRCS